MNRWSEPGDKITHKLSHAVVFLSVQRLSIAWLDQLQLKIAERNNPKTSSNVLDSCSFDSAQDKFRRNVRFRQSAISK